MASQLGEAHIPVRATTDKLDGDLEKARGKVRSSIDRITGNLQTAGAVALSGVGVAAGAIAGIGAALGKVTLDAAPVQNIADAFDGLADSAGMGGKAMLKALNEGSAGMVSNTDLMQSFNKAAGLVSVDFATQLPNAMQYLSKVSAATGTDMNYMLDSLVTGVGRLSPQILDNLQIQVSLSEATARAAEMFGVEESALDKAQTQAGMMSVAMEKLEKNTASMPDVTESASAKLAQMKATFQNTKDEIGMAFLPVLNTVLGVFGEFAGKFAPQLTTALEIIAPVVEKIGDAFGNFAISLMDGEDPMTAFTTLIVDLFPPDVAANILAFVMQVQDFIAMVSEAAQPLIDFVMNNVQLSDVLIGLGVAIATLVVPAIGSIIAALAPIVATFLAVVAVVALLRTAWENDFLGIRTALTEFWDNKAKPALDNLIAWLKEKVPEAIDKLKTFWTDVLVPAMQEAWKWFEEKILPTLKTLAEFVKTVLVVGFQIFIELVKDVVIPKIKELWEWFNDKIMPVIQKVAGWLKEKLQPAFEGISDVVGKVIRWIEKLTEKLQNLDVSKLFTPGSPTPFETGLRGIGGALSDLSSRKLPQFTARLDLLPEVPGVTGFLTGADSGSAQLDTSRLEAKIDSLGRMLPVAFRDAVRMMA